MSECANCGAELHTSRETCSRECQEVMDLPDEDPDVNEKEKEKQ